MHTCKVKLGHDLDATYQVQYMEYEIGIQQLGKEKLLISKQKAFSLT